MRAAARANTDEASKGSDVRADPPDERGRPPSSGKRARHAPDGPTGVMMAARTANDQCEQGKSARGEEVAPGSTANP